MLLFPGKSKLAGVFLFCLFFPVFIAFLDLLMFRISYLHFLCFYLIKNRQISTSSFYIFYFLANLASLWGGIHAEKQSSDYVEVGIYMSLKR